MIKIASLPGLCLAFASLAFTPSFALAGSLECAKVDVPKHIIADHGGRWVELAPAQWQFLRGVYAADPTSPTALPVGDHAALAQMGGADFGLVFFIDGDRACSPIVVSHDVVEMLRDVGTGQINHAGEGL